MGGWRHTHVELECEQGEGGLGGPWRSPIMGPPWDYARPGQFRHGMPACHSAVNQLTTRPTHHGHGDALGLRVLNQLGAAVEVPLPPGRDDLDVGLERVVAHLEAHLRRMVDCYCWLHVPLYLLERTATRSIIYCEGVGGVSGGGVGWVGGPKGHQSMIHEHRRGMRG